MFLSRKAPALIVSPKGLALMVSPKALALIVSPKALALLVSPKGLRVTKAGLERRGGMSTCLCAPSRGLRERVEGGGVATKMVFRTGWEEVARFVDVFCKVSERTAATSALTL